eukprot:SAG11_NODE_14382_length_614_cov_0.996117_1_plen_90_part_01
MLTARYASRAFWCTKNLTNLSSDLRRSFNRCRFVCRAWGEVSWRGALTEPAETISAGGVLELSSERPGLGLCLHKPTVEAHSIQICIPRR